MYHPKFISWAKSYEDEVRILKELISNQPSDEKQLRLEYQILTGKRFRATDRN